MHNINNNKKRTYVPTQSFLFISFIFFQAKLFFIETYECDFSGGSTILHDGGGGRQYVYVSSFPDKCRYTLIIYRQFERIFSNVLPNVLNRIPYEYCGNLPLINQ